MSFQFSALNSSLFLQQYAPEPPWNEQEILRVFVQMIRQLANLSHCTSPASANYVHYTSILHQLAEVKVGVVLVELIRSLDPSGTPSQQDDFSGEEETTREEATEVLCDLIRTIIHSISIEHPAEVFMNAIEGVSACIDEFYNNTPIPVLDEILAPIGAGPVVYVTNPAAVEAAAAIAEQKKKRGKKGGASAVTIKMPPQQIQQANRSYHVAAGVLRKTEDRISNSVANLLNGLLAGDAIIVDQTNISSADAPSSASNKSSTSDVWSIIYELHKISTQVLTTVIGNLAPLLLNEDTSKRIRVTKLLGSLFCSPSSNIAFKYRICFRKWLGRHHDAEVKVRMTMVKQLTAFMEHKAQERELCEEVTETLIKMMGNDPDKSVRIECVHKVCDLAHKEQSVSNGSSSSGAGSNKGFGPVVPAKLLMAVANRVAESKEKVERKDALTGLAQIYFRHYVADKLRDVQSGGDDCDVGIIIDALHNTCSMDHSGRSAGSKRKSKTGRRRGGTNGGESTYSYDVDDKYKWIPNLIFSCARFTDANDPDMRDRVNQIVDDVLLGSFMPESKDESSSRRKRPLSPTSRAVGFSMIVQALRDADDNGAAFKYMGMLLLQKSNLQTALSSYIDARSNAKNFEQGKNYIGSSAIFCSPVSSLFVNLNHVPSRCFPSTIGSEEALTAEAQAMEKLEMVAQLSSPIGSPSDLDAVLQSLNAARDKHIFRLLATIATPNHSSSARARAFEELPKRAKSLGSNTAAWVKKLARRCAMGGFVNQDSISTCILLAQECFHEGDIDCTMVFLRAVKTAIDAFPRLATSKESFGTLVELFGECQSSHVKNKKQIEEARTVSLLGTILALASRSLTLASSDQVRSHLLRAHTSLYLLRSIMRPSNISSNILATTSIQKGKSKDGSDDDASFQDDVQDLLIRLCTRDGTALQARNAVFTMAQLSKNSSTSSPASGEAALRKEREVFEPLLKALTSPSRMTIDDKRSNSSGGGGAKRIVSILSALAAVAEFAPSTFCASNGRGGKAIKFALESVLLGRSHSDESDSDSVHDGGSDAESSDDDDESASASKSRRRSSHGRRRSSGSVKGSSVDADVSLAALRACAAIELLVAHIRATADARNKSVKGIQSPAADHITAVFATLEQILRDNGLPPSSRDRRYCTSSADRASLRQCAAVNLLRLCDPYLQLESRFLSNACWQALSGAFVDEENSVREMAIDELSHLVVGSGKYNHGNIFAPSLRLLSLIVLCPDADHGRNNLAASGNAAVVGKKAELIKKSASNCIISLRNCSEQVHAQCLAQGKAGETYFENELKLKLMPECAVPYALHLLSFRRETPSVGGANTDAIIDEEVEKEDSDDDGTNTVAQDGAGQKMLRKRLKWLLEPLIQTLGDSANNISFLLRMVDLLGSRYQPTDVLRSAAPKEMDGEDDENEKSFDTVSSLGISLDETVAYRSITDLKRAEESQAKLKSISFAARDVLLKFVKKDVNLAAYPGAIRLPGDLFTLASKNTQTKAAAADNEPMASPSSANGSALRSPLSSTKKSQSSVQRHAHFSPELEARREYRVESDVDGGSPFDMDDDVQEDVVEEEPDEAVVEPVKAAATGRRKRSSYGFRQRTSPAADELPLSSSPREPRVGKESFGGMSPIASSASPALSTRSTLSTPTLASTRSGSKRKQREAAQSSQDTADSELPPSQSTASDEGADSPASTGKASPAKKRKAAKATPVKMNISAESTASKRPSRHAAKSRAASKKPAIGEPLVDDELDFDAGDDEFDDVPPKKRSGGRKIAISTGRSAAKTKSTSKTKASPATKSRGLAKSKLQNKSRRRAKA